LFPPASLFLSFDDLIHALKMMERGQGGGLIRFGLDGHCWGK
jgi:hypothetical protein